MFAPTLISEFSMFVIVFVSASIDAPAITPVSETVTTESCINLPVIPSNLAIALSVEDAGPTTSPEPPAAICASSSTKTACTSVEIIPAKGTTEIAEASCASTVSFMCACRAESKALVSISVCNSLSAD